MPETILISGASGLLGTSLTEALLKKGYSVKHLGRKKIKKPGILSYTWDPEKGEIEKEALIDTDYIINLAGSNVGEGRWTQKRKKELIASRIKSTRLLTEAIIQYNLPIKKFVQASAIGYYGLSIEDITYTEESPAGIDFLALLTQQWEKESASLVEHHIPLAIVRIGVVLSNKGGALMEMAKPVKWMVGSALGSGKQIIPWIHIDDMTNVFLKAIQDPSFIGIYNAVAPHPVTNKEFVLGIGRKLKRPIWPIPVPAFVLNILLGEQAQIVTKGNKVSSEKLQKAGYQFVYSQLEEALRSLLLE